MVTRHVNPIGISVQGPRFAVVPPQSTSTPNATRPTSVVQQVATPSNLVATPPDSVTVPSISVATPSILMAMPPRQNTGTMSGAYVPAFVLPFDGTGVVTTSYPTTSVSSFGTAGSTGYSVSASRVAVPLGSAITTVPRIPAVNSVFPPPSVFRSPLVPTVQPIPLVPPGIDPIDTFSFIV